METSIALRALTAPELVPALFAGFRRRQEVTRCWRKEAGRWVLRDIAFIDDWSPEDYAYLLECLRRTVKTGGAVLGAFDGERLVGFASVETERFGPRGEYLQLSSLHVSEGERGRGIGRALFLQACREAAARGAEKLYISGHSAQETQAFYRAMGCVEAAEYNRKLAEAEPCDCQLERALSPICPSDKTGLDHP